MAGFWNDNDNETQAQGTDISMTRIYWEPESSANEPELKEKRQDMHEISVLKVGVLASPKLGEFINTLPALDALHLSYPGADIVLLGQAWQKRFIEGRPGPIDRVEVLPANYESSSPLDSERNLDVEAFITRMQEEKFDILLQMKDGGRCSNLFVSQLKPRLTAGLRAPEAPPLDRWIPYAYHQQQVLRNLEVVGLIGAEPVSLDPKLVICEEDRQESYRELPETEQPLAVIYPGSGDPRCRWPLEKFAALGDNLAWEGAQVVIVGTKAEYDLAASLAGMMNARAVNLCGKLSISGLAGLFNRAQVVIANDSGYLQLANACGAATVGNYWCGNLLATGPVTHARHRIAISWQINCPVCGLDSTRNDCGHKATFFAGISKDEVIKPALEFIREGSINEQREEKIRTPESPDRLKSSRVKSYERPDTIRTNGMKEGDCHVEDNSETEAVFPGEQA